MGGRQREGIEEVLGHTAGTAALVFPVLGKSDSSHTLHVSPLDSKAIVATAGKKKSSDLVCKALPCLSLASSAAPTASLAQRLDRMPQGQTSWVKIQLCHFPTFKLKQVALSFLVSERGMLLFATNVEP